MVHMTVTSAACDDSDTCIRCLIPCAAAMIGVLSVSGVCVSLESVSLVRRPSLTQAVSLVKSAAKVLPPLGYSPLRGYSVLKGYPPADKPSDTANTAVVAEEEQVTQSSVEDVSADDTFELVPQTHMFYETTGNVGQVKVRETVVPKFKWPAPGSPLLFSLPACQIC